MNCTKTEDYTSNFAFSNSNTCDPDCAAQPAVRKNSAKLSINTGICKADGPNSSTGPFPRKSSLKLGFKVCKDSKDSVGVESKLGSLRKFSVFLVSKTWEIHLKLLLNSILLCLLFAKLASIFAEFLFKFFIERLKGLQNKV